MTIYLNKGDRSNCPRRRGFKFVIYQLLPREMWRQNSVTIFDKLEERSNEFMESNQGAKIF